MAVHLVTGGAGFLGGEMARALASRGERVRVLDVLPATELPPEVEVMRGDVVDVRCVREAVEGVDVVHHYAAMVPLTKAGADFHRVNVEGTQTVVDAARAAGVSFFIHVSSSAVYGVPRRCPMTEETPPRPIEAYGRAKLQGEERVRTAARAGFPCAIVRPRTVIGRRRLGIFQVLFEWIREARRIYVIGSGEQRCQLLHAEDVVDFMLLLAERRKTGVYNLGAARFDTLRADLTAVIRHAGTESRVVGVPAALAIGALAAADWLRLSPLGPWHYRTYHKDFFFDVSRAMRELEWTPKYSNRELLEQSYDWFVANESAADSTLDRSVHRKPVKEGILGLLRRLS